MAYITDFEIISPLGNGTETNFKSVVNGETSIKKHNRFFSSQFQDEKLIALSKLNNLNSKKLNKTVLLADTCLRHLQNKTHFPFSNANSQLLICSTKGNIDLPLNSKKNNSPLLELSLTLQATFQLANKPIVISNACISGLSGIIQGCRLLNNTHLEHIIVLGIDVVSQFVLKGFNSLTALDNKPCRPYDTTRNGISIGEAAAAVVLSKQSLSNKENYNIHGYGITNDANHISGPSRTGKGLADAIKKAIQNQPNIDFISSHGTGTLYNDEMESLAFQNTGFVDVPILSYKGNYGHTLGASGVLETILSCLSLKHNLIPASKGYSQKGVSGKISVANQKVEKPLSAFLKTGSGFGGGNAALVVEKS